MSTVDEVFSSLGLWEWYKSSPTQVFDGTTEKGEDFAQGLGVNVGAVAPGKVISVAHNNNSINDIVMILGPSGLWLYQHINAKVAVGDTVNVGDIVGSENGLPADQYSSGSHIEVRHASTYLPGVDSWYQPWSNPSGLLATIGSQDVGATNTTDYATGNASSPATAAGDTAQIGPSLEQIFINTALVLIALVLLGSAVYLLFHNQINAVASTAAKVAI